VDLPIATRVGQEAAALRDFDPAYDRCHPVGMVLNQLALSEAQWRTEVEKMRTVYKAPIVDKIISYLYDLSHH
jgi:hypothetical protein